MKTRLLDFGPPLDVRTLAATLAVGCVGAVIAQAVGLPAAPLAGALASVAVAAIAGFDMQIDSRARQVGFVVVGAVLGAAVTPETLDSLPRWPISLTVLGVSVVLLMLAVPAYLSRWHGIDPLTARLAAVPGALSYVLAVSLEVGADVRRVAILQTLRLVSLMLAIPIAVALTMDESAFVACDWAVGSAGEMAALLVLCSLAALLASWMRVLAGAFLASMLTSGLLHGADLIHGTLPMWLAWPALVLTGSAIGARFAGIDRHFLFHSLTAGLGALLISAAISLAFAWPTAALLGMPLAQVWLAFAPGGLDTMTVLAFSLGVDPAFVAGHQLLRFVGLSVVVPFLFRRPEATDTDAGEAAGQGRSAPTDD